MITEFEKRKNRVEDYFRDVSFVEDTHSYYVKGKKLNTSVSSLVKKFVLYTDFGKIAINIDKKKDLTEGTTKKLWKNKSSVALAIGNKAHYFGEIYAFNRNITPTDNYEVAITKFWKSLPDHIVPAFVELQMYHKPLMFGGMSDIILYNTKTEKFIIADYKTNADLFDNFGEQRLLHPFTDLLDNGYNQYQIQFSLYQILFEQTGMEVEKRCLIWLKPDGSFKTYFTHDLTSKLKKVLKTWQSSKVLNV